MKNINGLKIWVNGIVQGVGFRPFVYKLATLNNLTGWVRNSSRGVEIELNGLDKQLQTFLEMLQANPPPLAQIHNLETETVTPESFTSFEIIPSQPESGEFIPVSPDVSICADCKRELSTPSDRRFRYPFINCTNCGPRFTIIKDIPYDRPETTMSSFELCEPCKSEYDDPLDRRFHAQPVACPNCGPNISFISDGKSLGEKEEALQIARAWLSNGKILAIKGLGGYHLACDATNPDAVSELRKRKKRSEKPFALMVYDIHTIRQHCETTSLEEEILCSRQHPIVLLERRPESKIVLDVAPHQPNLGMILPYTPLHILILEPKDCYPEVLVMTSGNLSEEPIAYEDEDAFQHLSDLADGFLVHNRPIYMRTDDSVIRIIQNAPYVIRRSRGYAPDPIQLPEIVPQILSTGAELKNTFCLTRKKYAFLSHHIGDMENYATYKSFEDGITHFEKLFKINPEIIACDLHPDYLATKYARNRAEEHKLQLIQIQHHHAHLASCLAENGWDSDDAVIGLCFDGSGLGTDNKIWGGEFLLGNYTKYQRMYHLKYIPLPGGDISVKKPSRMALSYLRAAGIDWDPSLPSVNALCSEERTALRAQLEHNINSPLTSSMGRLFDAISALIGIRQEVTYEAQAAIELENISDPDETGYYNFQVIDDSIDPSSMLEAIMTDLYAGAHAPILAARFHNSLVRLFLEICKNIRAESSSNTVALSGGVWQNRLLLERTMNLLDKEGFIILVHNKIPANDGGISFGQAVIAAKTHHQL